MLHMNYSIVRFIVSTTISNVIKQSTLEYININECFVPSEYDLI